MKTRILIPLALSTLLLIFSCQKSDEILDATKVETEQAGQIGAPRAGISKATFMGFSNEDKKAFWLGKFDFLLQDPNLDSAQQAIILALRTELRNMGTGVFEFTDAARAIALDAVDVFSEADFLATFVSLDYNTLSPYSSPTCSWCPDEINAAPPSSQTGMTALPDCDCSWSCSDDACYAHGLLDWNNCCIPTPTGCGFINVQSCDGYDG